MDYSLFLNLDDPTCVVIGTGDRPLAEFVAAIRQEE
jgi:hypothetical protein